MTGQLITDAGPDSNASPPPRARRPWRWVIALAIAGPVIGGMVIFGWMLDETHFDRPSRSFDDLEAQLEALPGVVGAEKERWVEAPTFSDPMSWMAVTVDAAGLPGLLDAACATGYSDPVSWSFTVRTPSKSDVVVVPADTGDSTSGTSCRDFGFDAVGLVGALDEVAPGLAIQAAVWHPGRFDLFATELDAPPGIDEMAPLIARIDEVVAAADLDRGTVVDVSATNVSVAVSAGQGRDYAALLTELFEEHHVASFTTSNDGPAAGPITRIHISAPVSQQAAITRAVEASRLGFADVSLQFVEP